jgi:hypothetical protein
MSVGVCLQRAVFLQVGGLEEEEDELEGANAMRCRMRRLYSKQRQ